ncbi:MAG: NTP transferase domain-containing protein, partial [Acidobacteria bacterium]|nr:NTP transferase domain-containing protein [Acidobacteriota bacterium]
GGATVIDVLTGRLCRGGIDSTTVVVAAGDDHLLAHCAAAGVQVIVNHHPESGMLPSIQLGHRALGGALADDDIVLVCPVDYPAVRPETVRRILTALSELEAEAVVPSTGGRRGHPLALSAPTSSAIHELDAAIGLRQLLRRVAALEIEVDDPAIHRDLDTWSDYADLVAQLAREEQ